jgi:hypothetical protein
LEELNTTSKMSTDFRDGFWLRVLSRHFLISQLANRVADQDWLHFENDCLSFITPQILTEIRATNVGVAVPFESRARAIPVVVHVKSASVFNQLTKELLVASNQEPLLLDMDIWAVAAANNPSLFTPLPTILDKTWVVRPSPELPREQKELVPADWQWKEAKNFSVIFDAAALGQFVAGCDPHNQHFLRAPGHVHQTAWLDVQALNWRLSLGYHDALPKLEIQTANSPWVGVANLHMHNKKIPDLFTQGEQWQQLISAANGQTPRSVSFAWDLLISEIRSEPKKGPRLISDLIYHKTVAAQTTKRT